MRRDDDVELIGISFDDVVVYVEAVENLVASLEADLKKGPKISSNTIVALSRYARAAQNVTPLLDAVDEDSKKYN